MTIKYFSSNALNPLSTSTGTPSCILTKRAWTHSRDIQRPCFYFKSLKPRMGDSSLSPLDTICMHVRFWRVWVLLHHTRAKIGFVLSSGLDLKKGKDPVVFDTVSYQIRLFCPKLGLEFRALEAASHHGWNVKQHTTSNNSLNKCNMAVDWDYNWSARLPSNSSTQHFYVPPPRKIFKKLSNLVSFKKCEIVTC